MKNKNILTVIKISILLALAVININLIHAVQPNQYRITAEINPEKSSINGEVNIEFFNPLDEPLNYIPVRTSNPTDYFPDRINILQVFDSNGNQLEIVDNSEAEQIVNIQIPDKILPRESVEITINFQTTNISKPFGFSLVQGVWHPKAAVYRHGGFSLVEEQADNFDVKFIIPEEYSLFSSGIVMSEKNLENSRKSVHVSAQKITNFGFAYSKELISKETQVDDVKIIIAFESEDEDKFTSLLPIIKESLNFYKEVFGFYPQPLITVLPGSNRSMGGFPPASNIFCIHHRSFFQEDYKKWIVAHEMGHFYWGFDCVIDSRKYGNWLGLALGIYVDNLYNKQYNKDAIRFSHNNFIYSYIHGVKNEYNTSLMQDYIELEKLKFDWNNVISHGKSYTVIYLLEQITGEDTFFEILQTLLQDYKHKYLSVEDFRKTVERIANKDLKWFFDDWVYGNKVFDYRIDTVYTKNNQTFVATKRVGDARLPLNLRVSFEDGSSLIKPLDKDEQFQEIPFNTTINPVFVDLNPEYNFIKLFVNPEYRFWGEYIGLEVVKTKIPDLAWNINHAEFMIVNNSNETRELLINIQSHPLDVRAGGFGNQTNHVLKPGDTITITREVPVRIIPGRHKISLGIRDITVNYTIYNKEIIAKFSHVNYDIKPFITEEYSWVVDNDYPALQLYMEDNLVIYYLPNDNYLKQKISTIFSERKKALQEISSVIYPEFRDTIAIFFFANEKIKSDFIAHKGMGLALPNNTIYEVYNEQEKLDKYHELVHIVASKIGSPPAVFNEGQAVYFHEDQKWGGFHFNAWVKKFADDNRLIPLKELFMFNEIGSIESNFAVAYPQSASIVNFLIHEFGHERFLKAYKTINMKDIDAGLDVIDSKLKDVFGIGVYEIENLWLESISYLDIKPASSMKE